VPLHEVAQSPAQYGRVLVEFLTCDTACPGSWLAFTENA
jgi:hypothetical protein